LLRAARNDSASCDLCASNDELFRGRGERQKDYRLRKQFRALAGDTIANSWEGEREDRATGKKMAGFGVEIWIMRDGKIASGKPRSTSTKSASRARWA
jgi:nuclear transport factor 2 (NTF2) superfamily protein